MDKQCLFLQNSPVTLSELLGNILSDEQDIEFAVLVGSRALGDSHSDSDWDIALQWDKSLEWMKVLAATEAMRIKLANALGVTPDKIDLIELRRANLAMRASVAEDGIPLKGADSLAWARFLTRTWRELEDFYWEKSHAA